MHFLFQNVIVPLNHSNGQKPLPAFKSASPRSRSRWNSRKWGGPGGCWWRPLFWSAWWFLSVTPGIWPWGSQKWRRSLCIWMMMRIQKGISMEELKFPRETMIFTESMVMFQALVLVIEVSVGLFFFFLLLFIYNYIIHIFLFSPSFVFGFLV